MDEQKNVNPSQSAVQPTSSLQPSRLEQLMAENLALTKEIYELTNKTRRYLYFSQVATVIKMVLIIAPLVAAALLLPPYLKQAFSAYKELLGNGTGQTVVEGNGIIQGLISSDLSKVQELKSLLDNYQTQ